MLNVSIYDNENVTSFILPKMIASVIAISSLIPLLTAYSTCNIADAKGPITINIVSQLTQSNIEVSGKIEIIDGCNVRDIGLIFISSLPLKTSSFWIVREPQSGMAAMETIRMVWHFPTPQLVHLLEEDHKHLHSEQL